MNNFVRVNERLLMNMDHILAVKLVGKDVELIYMDVGSQEKKRLLVDERYAESLLRNVEGY